MADERKVNIAATAMVKLMADLDMDAEEGLMAVTKVMHFTIEKGFGQCDEKTTELVINALSKIAMGSVTSKN